MFPQIHFIITTILAFWAGLSAWLQFKQSRKVASDQEHAACQEDSNKLDVRLAVLEERMHNQMELLNKLDSKIDEVLKCL
jgi:hypothetical protein